MKILFLRSMLIILLLSGCGNKSTISSYYSFSDQNWKYFDNPIIEIDITNPGVFYDMWVELDHDLSLPRNGLPVTVIMSTPSGEVRSRNLTFKTDSIAGKIRLILRKDFAFSEKGKCTFEIENRSQHTEIPGLEKIGIVFEKTK